MPANSNLLSNESLDRVVGTLLRVGVSLAAAVVFAGGLVYLVRHGTAMPTYHLFRGEPNDLLNIQGIWQDVLSGRGRGIIQLGLLLLIATPVARVAYLVYAFSRQKDRLYAGVALLVLLLLAYGLAGGHV